MLTSSASSVLGNKLIADKTHQQLEQSSQRFSQSMEILLIA